jgi:hypothetical protein
VKHWKPDEADAVPLAPPPATAKRAALPPGALAGLLLVATGCVGVTVVLYMAFARADVFANVP